MTSSVSVDIGWLRSQVANELSREGHQVKNLPDRRELARKLAIEQLQKLAEERVIAGERPLGAMEERELAKQVLDALFGLGRLQTLVDNPEIENIDVNGCDRVWVTFADGTKMLSQPITASDDELVEILRSAAARFGISERRFDTAHPDLDLRLPDGSRLSALMSVSSRPLVSIRRHRYLDLALEDLVRLGTVDNAVADLLAAAVRARKNIVIAGAMNSGKTTLVRALASEIAAHERVVTIEQAFELALDEMADRHPDLVALEAREANAEGEGAITMAKLVRRALRMNADRVIVGEVLGDEVLPMLNAMSQGRSGSMCTIHADSSEGVFRRIASYAIQAPERLPLEATNLLIAGALHFVVFIDLVEQPSDNGQNEPRVSRPRTQDAEEVFARPPRKRLVTSVREIVDAEGMQVISNEIFRATGDGRTSSVAPLRSRTLEELRRHGYHPRTSNEIR